MVRKLRRARQKRAWQTQVLSREGADTRTLGKIYLVVVQAVLLYGSETWVLTPHMQRVLGGFHHRVARRLTRKKTRKVRDGGWVYPPLEDLMVEAGLQEVETDISHRQNTVAQYIVTRTIMDLCLLAKRRPGPRVTMRWGYRRVWIWRGFG